MDIDTEVLVIGNAPHGSDVSSENPCFEGTNPTVFRIDEQRYIVSGLAEPSITAYSGKSSLVTVMSLRLDQTVTEPYLSNEIGKYQSLDDVFHVRFLQGVVFSFHSPPIRPADKLISHGAIALLKSLKCEWIEFHTATNGTCPLANGVYVAAEKKLFQVYRAYDDVQGAFLESFLPGPEDSYVPIRRSGDQPGTVIVAVPSRSRSQPTPSKPLYGMRIAVKDNFHVKGIHTSLCNRAYRETYPPRGKTATCIQKLEDAGAQIIGTVKMAAFAATEEPIECVDYQAPWNPRGDGYQSPAGSSSGSGVAVASYDWLDIAIGSDTSGSGRRPGHWNGCFALRPSHGVLDTDGFVPSFRQFDTPTFLCRHIQRCRQFAAAWYGESLEATANTLPSQVIIASDYLPLIKNKLQLEIVKDFAADLASFLKVMPRQISFDDLWALKPPADAQNESLQQYMKDASRNSFFYDDYHSLDQFRTEYSMKFSRTPYISPPVRWQWNLCLKITRQERDEAVHRLAVYKEWFSKHVMKVGQMRTFVILPIENISPRYRDDATTSFNPIGVPMLFLSPILGGPELVIPSGQVPYHSKVSQRTEFQPVGISLLGSPGTDFEMMDTVIEFLKQSSRPTEVITGRTMFKS